MSECPEVKCPEGIPAWVMTFADLMSLLLAFFVLLFSFSEVDKNIYKELAGSMKDAFGVQREILAKETPRGINIIAREFSPGKPTPTPVNEVRQFTTDENKLHPVFTDPSESGQENKDKKADEHEDMEYNAMRDNVIDDEVARRLTKLGDDLQKKMIADVEAIKGELQQEINDGLIDIDVKDKRIILRIQEKGSFPSGSATIIQPFNAITSKIAKVFGEFDGKIVVSGHTDNIPIRTQRFRSNWELSASRAVSVIHALRNDKSLTDKRFAIEAYADTRPVDTNDSVLGRARNRRVEIMLDYGHDPSMIPIRNKKTGEYEMTTLEKAEADARQAMQQKAATKEKVVSVESLEMGQGDTPEPTGDETYFETVSNEFNQSK